MTWANMADRVLKTTISAFKAPGTYIRIKNPASPISLSGVFDEPNQEVDPQTGASVSSVHPTYGIRLADIPGGIEPGDKLLLGSRTYKILSVDEDGQGGADLLLGRIS